MDGPALSEVEVVLLKYHTETLAPGRLHVVLDAVSARAPYLLANRSREALRYRQAGIAGLPLLALPPLSAAGFAWQQPDLPGRAVRCSYAQCLFVSCLWRTAI